MNLARQLERRLERFVDGMAARIFRGSVQPHEIAVRLVREADLHVQQSTAGPMVPNVFEVAVNPADVNTEGSLGTVAGQLEAMIQATAADRGWRLSGPARVEIRADPAVPHGDIRCVTDVEPGEQAAWAELVDGARRHPLGPYRVTVGRGADADVRVDHTQVSRLHAVIWREEGRVLIADAGSANGTAVNGVDSSGSIEVRDGDALAFGPATLTFRSV